MSTERSPSPLFVCPSFEATVYPRGKRNLIFVEIMRNPDPHDVEKISAILLAWAQNTTHRFAMHWKHSDRIAHDVDPPDLRSLMTIVGTLLQNRDTLERRLVAVCMQGRVVDDLVTASKNLFLQLYQPKMRFDVVACDAEATAFLDEALARRAPAHEEDETESHRRE